MTDEPEPPVDGGARMLRAGGPDLSLQKRDAGSSFASPPDAYVGLDDEGITASFQRGSDRILFLYGIEMIHERFAS